MFIDIYLKYFETLSFVVKLVSSYPRGNRLRVEGGLTEVRSFFIVNLRRKAPQNVDLSSGKGTRPLVSVLARAIRLYAYKINRFPIILIFLKIIAKYISLSFHFRINLRFTYLDIGLNKKEHLI